MRFFLLALGFLIAAPGTGQAQLRDLGHSLAMGPSGQAPLILLPKSPAWMSVSSYQPKVKTRLGSIKIKHPKADWARWEKSKEELRTQGPRSYSGEHVLRDKEGQIRRVLLKGEEGRNGAWHVRIEALDEEVNHLELILRRDSATHIFGLGEQFSHVNMDGQVARMIPEENGIGRGDKPGSGLPRLVGAAGDEMSTYCPIPFWMESSGRAVYISRGTPYEIDFSEKGLVRILAEGSVLELKIWRSDNPLELLTEYTGHAGRFRMLPDWVWGTWLGVQGGPEKCERVVRQALEAGNPVTGLWIQDWVGKRKTPLGSRLFWNWKANPEAYPDLKEFIARMDALGVHTLGYINPFLVEDSPMVAEMQEQLVVDEEGEPVLLPAGGFKAYQFQLDLSDTTVRHLIQRNMIDLGFSGWMADFAEWYPTEGVPPQNHTWLSWHNKFPVAWQIANRAALMGHPRGDSLVFFSRSGYRETGKVASIYWAGDQLTAWGEHDGLPSAIKALITSGMSGILINHSDIGGYTNIRIPGTRILRDHELFRRWTEFAAFTPIFRTHEGLQPEHNVQPWSGPATVEFFARFGKIHFALKPYLKYLNQEATDKGWPMIRHLWLHYPDDPEVLDLRYQYLLGSDLLVAPIYEELAVRRKVYLPEGTWKHLFTGKQLGKGWHWVEAPAGEPPVFLRMEGQWAAKLWTALNGLR